MPRLAFRLLVPSLSILIRCLPAYGQTAAQPLPSHAESTDNDKENKAILEVGGATSWNVSGGAATFAPNFAAEVTPIENWLELEAGVTPTFTAHSTEWDFDLLFKKPWTLSRKAEFMFGVGPAWIHTNDYGEKLNSVVRGCMAFVWHVGLHGNSIPALRSVR